MKKQFFIIILLLLSACSPKNINLPSISQQDTKPHYIGEVSEAIKEMLKIYKVSLKGEINFNAQKGKAYVKWDEEGVTLFLSRDFAANPDNPLAEKLNGILTEFNKSLYSTAEGKQYLLGTEVYYQFDDNELIFFIPKIADAEAYYNHGATYYKKGQYDQAISDYSKALEINPRHSRAYRKRGDSHFNKGEYDLAISDFNKAIEINSRYAEAYNSRGNAYSNLRQYDQAISDYTKAIGIDPKYAKAYNNLAWLLATAKEPGIRNGEKAVEHALKACELSDWKDPNYLDTIAAAYARVGDFSKAIKWQEKALESPNIYKPNEARERLNFYQQHKPWTSD